MSTQSKSLRLADQLAAEPYAWPGGYPRYGVFSDGEACCKSCAAEERESIGTTTGTDGWTLTALEVNWEDPQLYCGLCSKRIESAYAEPDDE